MEDIFTQIILTILGILQLILFFKIWGMTDDVREIKEKYLSSENEIIINPNMIDRITGADAGMQIRDGRTSQKQTFPTMSWVIEKGTGIQMKIVRFDSYNGRYVCFYSLDSKAIYKSHTEDELDPVNM
jgi:hypothetical protein